MSLRKRNPPFIPHPTRDLCCSHNALLIHHCCQSITAPPLLAAVIERDVWWLVHQINQVWLSLKREGQRGREWKSHCCCLFSLPAVPPCLLSPYHLFSTSVFCMGSLLLIILCSSPLVPALTRPEEYSFLHCVLQHCLGALKRGRGGTNR